MALKFSIDFITKFLSDNGVESLQQKWTDEVPKYKKLFKKTEIKTLNKDSKGPKKNKSAYNIFCSQNISIIKKELPDLDNKAIFSEMAKRWKKVKNTDDFNKYQALAQEDKERYTAEKFAILKNGNDDVVVESVVIEPVVIEPVVIEPVVVEPVVVEPVKKKGGKKPVKK